MKQNTFTKWVRAYCKYKGYSFTEEPANTKESMVIQVEPPVMMTAA